MAKRPPMKKDEAFPKYLVLCNENDQSIGKVEFQSEADLQVFYDENNMSADDVVFVTEDEFNKTEIIQETTKKETEIVLDETPVKRLTENDIPDGKFEVENKKTGKRFTVNRKHYLAHQGELKLV